MASKKNPPTQRIDSDFEKDMREIARVRVQKGLAGLKPEEIGMPEMTRLLRRTQGYQISIDELKTKPKRKDI